MHESIRLNNSSIRLAQLWQRISRSFKVIGIAFDEFYECCVEGNPADEGEEGHVGHVRQSTLPQSEEDILGEYLNQSCNATHLYMLQNS